MKRLKYVYDKLSLANNSDKYLGNSIVAFIIGVAVLFLSCADRSRLAVTKDSNVNDNLPALDSEGYELSFTENGIVVYFLTTPRLIKYEDKDDPYIEFPDGFHVMKFGLDRVKISELSANYGKRFEKEQKLEAIGNVIAINAEGDTLRTEHLIMLEKDDRIFSDKYVRIIKKEQVITGIGFESDSEMKNWTITNPRGTIYGD